MSAYVVEDKTVNRIVTALEFCALRGSRGSLDDLPMPPKRLLQLASEPETLADNLRRMNEDAINARYQDASDMMPDSPIKFSGQQCSAIQLYKSLQCFLYQCSEGDVDSRPLFADLRTWQHEIADHLVSQLPEYDKAEWA